MDEVMHALHEAQQGREFSSIEDANRFMQEFMIRQNTAPRDAFAGLSPTEMRSILSTPLDAAAIVTFTDVLTLDPVSPITTIFKALADAIGEKGFKPTATGNLPRNTVREISRAINGTDTFGTKDTQYLIQKETDYFDLHITRLIAALAGLIRKYKGRFILTKKCRPLLDRHGIGGIWPSFSGLMQKNITGSITTGTVNSISCSVHFSIRSTCCTGSDRKNVTVCSM